VPPRLSLSVYRPRPGHESEVVAHLRDEVAMLRARGHITASSAAVCRSARGEYLAPRDLAGSEVPFASFGVLGDA